MAEFHHHCGGGGVFVTSFRIRQGDRAAGLEWTLRDGWAREILIFRSTQGIVGDGVDPTLDHRQRVVYQGTGRDARVDDDLSHDIAYHYRDDIRYYYSVFAPSRGADLETAPRAVSKVAQLEGRTAAVDGQWWDSRSGPSEIVDQLLHSVAEGTSSRDWWEATGSDVLDRVLHPPTSTTRRS